MQTANYEERYAGMSDGELADLVSDGIQSLNEEARYACQAELRKRGLTLAALREQYPPEALSDDVRGESKVSLVKEFGVFPGLPIASVLVLLLYVPLVHKPFATQTITVLEYTVLVFVLVFCDTRGFKGYSLGQKAVRQKMPRLLAIHAVFLVIVFTVVTIAPWLRRSVPDSWLVEGGRRHLSLFDYLLALIGTGIWMIQVWISRKILSRSVEADRAAGLPNTE